MCLIEKVTLWVVHGVAHRESYFITEKVAHTVTAWGIQQPMKET